MGDHTSDQIRRYFGSDLANLRLLGITTYSIRTYAERVRGGQSKDAAIAALLQGRTLDQDHIQYVRAVLDRLPAVQRAGGTQMP